MEKFGVNYLEENRKEKIVKNNLLAISDFLSTMPKG